MPLFTGDPAKATAIFIATVFALWLGAAFLAGWAFHN